MGNCLGRKSIKRSCWLAGRLHDHTNHQNNHHYLFEIEALALKLRVKTDILGAGEGYSVQCAGTTDFLLEREGGGLEYRLWDSQGVTEIASQLYVHSLLDLVLAEMNETIYTYSGKNNTSDLHLNGMFAMLFFAVIRPSPGGSIGFFLTHPIHTLTCLSFPRLCRPCLGNKQQRFQFSF